MYEKYEKVIDEEMKQIDENSLRINVIFDILAKHFPNEIADPNVPLNIMAYLISDKDDNSLDNETQEAIAQNITGYMALCHCSPMSSFAYAVLNAPDLSSFKEKNKNNLSHFEKLLEDDKMVDVDSIDGSKTKSGELETGQYGFTLDTDNIDREPEYINYSQLVKKFNKNLNKGEFQVFFDK